MFKTGRLAVAFYFTSLSVYINAENCSDIGFNSDVLRCSLCNALDSFNLAPIRDSCLKCCVPDVTEVITKYASARLEVCTCKFGMYPQVAAFVKGVTADMYPNLEIRYIHGREPAITLMNDKDEVITVVNIEKWNTDSIHEFLRTHLQGDEDTDFLMSNMI